MEQLKVTENIIDFIKQQKCMSICCLNLEGLPYCFSCYYAFNSDAMQLYFKSSTDSNHVKYLNHHQKIAGTILPDKLKNLIVQGIQFEGSIILHHEADHKLASKTYHSKFPFALVMPGEVWLIEIDSIKMTDSTQGFGKKLVWKKSNNTDAVV